MKNALWNLCINLKNNQITRRSYIYQLKTESTIAFLNILWNEGFILGYKVNRLNTNLLKIFLKYKNKNPVINSLKVISKPRFHLYYSATQLWKLKSKKTLIILTTTKGLLTVNECKRIKTGGKLLFIIK